MSRVLVSLLDLSRRPTESAYGATGSLRTVGVVLVRRIEGRNDDLPQANVRHALSDQQQKTAAGELDVIEYPAVQR